MPSSRPLRTILAVSLARGYGMLLSTATLFISARYLGPEGRGSFAAAIAWASLFATVFSLSLGQALQYRLQSASGRLSLGGQIGTLAGLGFGLSATALGLALACYVVTDGQLFKGIEPLLLALAFASVPLLVWEQYSTNLLSAASRLDIYNRAQYIGRTLALGLFVLLVAGLSYQVAGALAAQLAGQLILAGIVALPLIRLAGGRIAWVASEVRPLLSAGAKVHVTTISAFMLDQISILLINNYLSKAEVGQYQLAQQMVALLLVIPQAALMVIYGGIAQSDPDAFWPRQRRILLRVLAIILAVAVAAYALAPLAIPLVAGQQFQPAVNIFQTLLPTLLGQSLAIMLTPQWIGRGLFFLNNMLTLVSAVVVVGASWLIVPRFGVDGAVWVRLLVYLGLVSAVQLAFWRWCGTTASRAAR